MSFETFRETILEVAEEMLEEADPNNPYPHASLRNFSKQLKLICKVADDYSPKQKPTVSVEMQHILEVEKAKKEFRKSNKSADMEERFDGDMIEVVGGPVTSLDGVPVLQAIDPLMPEGAYTQLAGGVYQLKSTNGVKRLEFDEEQTKRVTKNRIKTFKDS